MPVKGGHYLFPASIMAASAFGVLACLVGAPIFPFGVCGYLVLSLVPGAGLYRLVSKDPVLIEQIIAALALSPVLTGAATTLVMLAGVQPSQAAAFVLVLTCVLGVFAFRHPRSYGWTLDRRQAVALAAVLVVVSALTSYLPLAHDWWRMRSDSWFHGAVIAQIADYGIPPEDPYMIGMPLQYMWFFHVLAVALSKASGIGPFMVMALVNVQTLVGFGLGAFVFSSMFRRAFSQNMGALVTAVFGMNAAIWLFLPVKLLRALAGEVRGADELARTFSLTPFDVYSVRSFVQLGLNQEFLLDKFMVGTAFSVGLCLMAVLWWAAARYITSEKTEYLATAFVAAFGVVVFHTAIGVVTFAGVAGSLFLLVVLRRFLKGYEIRPILKILAAMAISGVLLLPYLHSVTHAKTGDEALPLGFGWQKIAGIVVSCALVIFLAAFQCRRIVRAKDLATYFLVSTTAAMFGLCAIIRLPAANAYDKFPFLVFFPLAVVGGWTIAEFAQRAPTSRRRTLRWLVASLLAFGPLNIFMFAGYYNTAPILRMNQTEKEVAAWIGAATPRESVMIDSKPNVFLLVAGPRRYYLATEFFAMGWGYDRSEIDKRKQAITDLYSHGELEPVTLEALGGIPYPLYILVRRDDGAVDSAKFGRKTDLFRRVFTSGSIDVYEADRAAFLGAARERPEA